MKWECVGCDEQFESTELTVTASGQPACPNCGEEVGTLFFPGDEAPLNASLDDYLTRTPAHPFDGDEVPDDEC